MTWYKAFYGSWNAPGGVKHIYFGDNYVNGTYKRKEAFEKAQAVADETGEIVTVLWETPRAGRGLVGGSQYVYPKNMTGGM